MSLESVCVDGQVQTNYTLKKQIRPSRYSGNVDDRHEAEAAILMLKEAE